jgi:hypothetical protein
MTVTLKNATPLVVPSAIQRRAGLASASQVEFPAAGGVITITAKPPAADDEYTPEQRRVIDAQLAKAAKSPAYGPFTAAQATRFTLRERAIGAPASAPLAVQKAFIKQMNFLARSLQHPSLHAKKYNQAQEVQPS